MADGKSLREVLDVVREYGLSVQVVRVEGIVLQLSKPWPFAVATATEKPPTTDESQLADELRPHPKVLERLEMLRVAFRKQFGRESTSDKELELVAPALVGGAA